jgi:CspA family cold shock protein
MAEGTLRWFNETTGYGLIRPDDGRRDLFVRGTDMAIGGAEPLEEGAEVSYEVKQRANGMRAIDVARRRRYSWRDDSLQRHEGKEARHGYYAQLDEGEGS